MTDFCPNCFAQDFAGRCGACGYLALAQAGAQMMLVPGALLGGRYLVGRVLGAGGFGVTYLAKDTHTGARVAVKEYFPTLLAVRSANGATVSASGRDNAENFSHGLSLFCREAETLRRFAGNAGVVQVMDCFPANGTSYFAMEFLDGVNLAGLARASGGKLGQAHVLEVLTEISRTLCAVHAQGLLHRDVSPENIFVTKDGHIKLIDFGATRFFVGERSRSLSIVLKPGFAPPEQYSSKGNQGPWTDLYALCATCYALVTGKRPPDAPDRLAGAQLEPLEAHGLAPQTAAAVQAGLALDYRSRPATIDAFLALLGQLPAPQVANVENLPQPPSLPSLQSAPPLPYSAPAQRTPPAQALQENAQALPHYPAQHRHMAESPPPIPRPSAPVQNAPRSLQGGMQGVRGTPYLQCVQNGVRGDRWLLPKNMPLRIGRASETCHIVLDNPNISRVHCELCYEEKAGVFFLTDCSTNGTFCRGIRIPKGQAQQLAPGDLFFLLTQENGMEVGLC